MERRKDTDITGTQQAVGGQCAEGVGARAWQQRTGFKSQGPQASLAEFQLWQL